MLNRGYITILFILLCVCVTVRGRFWCVCEIQMNRVSLCMGLSNSVCHVTSVYVAMCARLRETVCVCMCVCERDRLRLYVPKHILYIMHIYACTCLTVRAYIYIYTHITVYAHV